MPFGLTTMHDKLAMQKWEEGHKEKAQCDVIETQQG